MKLKPVLGVLIFLLVISLTFFIRVNQQLYSGENTTVPPLVPPVITPPLNPPSDTPPSDPNLISQSTLGQHASRDDCWVAYNGKVYDITSYLPRHPGGTNRILTYCGSATEFENAFTRQHGTSKVSVLMNVGTFIGDFDVMGSLG